MLFPPLGRCVLCVFGRVLFIGPSHTRIFIRVLLACTVLYARTFYVLSESDTSDRVKRQVAERGECFCKSLFLAAPSFHNILCRFSILYNLSSQIPYFSSLLRSSRDCVPSSDPFSGWPLASPS